MIFFKNNNIEMENITQLNPTHKYSSCNDVPWKFAREVKNVKQTVVAVQINNEIRRK